MNIMKTVNGIIVIVLGALLLVDGILGLAGALDEALLSLPVTKLVVGIIALVVAGTILSESQK